MARFSASRRLRPDTTSVGTPKTFNSIAGVLRRATMRGLWLRTGRLRGDVEGTACPYRCSQRSTTRSVPWRRVHHDLHSCDFRLRLFRTVLTIAKGVSDNAGDMII